MYMIRTSAISSAVGCRMGSCSVGGNREPVPTQNRFQLTNSIGIVRLQRYRFFLTIPHHVFRFTQKFCDNPARADNLQTTRQHRGK